MRNPVARITAVPIFDTDIEDRATLLYVDEGTDRFIGRIAALQVCKVTGPKDLRSYEPIGEKITIPEGQEADSARIVLALNAAKWEKLANGETK